MKNIVLVVARPIPVVDIVKAAHVCYGFGLSYETTKDIVDEALVISGHSVPPGFVLEKELRGLIASELMSPRVNDHSTMVNAA